MINVSKPYLPPLEEFNQYLEGIWNRSWLTNNGPLLAELEQQLTSFLGVKYLHIVSSGTIALQIALKAAQLKGDIITTAFSHVSTVNAVIWNSCKPVFVDIENIHYCIDPDKIEPAITSETCAILATHVYGFPCQHEKIRAIAERYNLKMVYDGAHAFGVKVKGQSLLQYGDVTAVSFHATKVFHTIEGGAIITNDPDVSARCVQFRNFGLSGTDYIIAGINGKNSEIHAAMGLCNLRRINDFIHHRQQLSELYHKLLAGLPLQLPVAPHGTTYNFAYFPVLFSSYAIMLSVCNALAGNAINARRYFYPSLNQLPYLEGASCPVSEDVSQRMLCLPLYYSLSFEEVKTIVQIIKTVVCNTGAIHFVVTGI